MTRHEATEVRRTDTERAPFRAGPPDLAVARASAFRNLTNIMQLLSQLSVPQRGNLGQPRPSATSAWGWLRRLIESPDGAR